MRKSPPPPGEIARVRYKAPAGYELDLEIIAVSEFRRRVSTAHLRQPQRVDFHLLLYVTKGRCVHRVDFEGFDCQRGALLLLRPAQVQQFDTRFSNLEGWMVIFRPELFPARTSTVDSSVHDALNSLTELSVYRRLSGRDQAAAAEALVRMAGDVQSNNATSALQALLRHQLLALLVRLYIIQLKGQARSTAAPVVLRRFERYRLAVEREFGRLHRVGDYARLIGCSQKSLQRASMTIAGVSAKTYLSQRIALEAKRLLVHTDRAVSVIADRLGFDEVTNFVKFFRRVTGSVPGEFRRRHTSR